MASSEPRESSWYQKSNKKVIPNHLVPKKKIGFQLSAVTNNKRDQSKTSTGKTDESFKTTDFNVITFGNKAHRNSNASFQDSSILALKDQSFEGNKDNEDLPLYNYDEDLPPPRSIYDLKSESSMAANKPTQQTESFITKDPRSFQNAFARSGAAEESKADDKKILKNPLQHSEAAVLVFGYPESMANQVIGHFLEFGTILEDFEAAKSTATSSPEEIFQGPSTGAFFSSKADETHHENQSKPPIFCGKSWVKLTYDNPSSAADALQESGSVFNGALIGVVPYTKSAVEKLQNRKLTSTEDIGGGLQGLQLGDLSSKVDKGVIGDSNDIQASYIKRLDIKDGSEMFLKAPKGDSQNPSEVKKPVEKLGFIGTISNYLFGFHDL